MSYFGPNGSCLECGGADPSDCDCQTDEIDDCELQDLRIVSIQKEVSLEIEKSTEKFGIQDFDAFRWLAILGEEYGESCQAAIQADSEPGKKTWADYREELVQTACVAIKAIENFDRRKVK